ncbi:mechanosensitive ion channel family protein [Brachybacterium endophyticum]|uniref:Mechanosensitive ion channel family protein n=1 Tax=Brachybacterium endophyticum TaxID=2182385 RepID=A0A2U2RLV3_9MICO|nr:mechanosensitive ion channel family protein [Brachybacterium endophyticum]PWH06853.1 mechanosensitive ion channel family protein [Brachybacterium endophyticum]
MPLNDLVPTLAAPADDAKSLMDAFVGWLTTHGVRIVVILLVATIATAVGSWLINRFVRTMIDSSTKISTFAGAVVKRDQRSAKAAQARREQRARTLSNVARNLLRMVVWAVAIVMILDQLGLNIAPVIASLGVLGLAAGIGAQNIIKDVVSGVLMLFEDLVAVGDVVDIEYASGTVENINLRTTQVRALDGSLWTVRNGEVIRVGNMSRGFSNAVVVLDIEPSADDAKVTEVLDSVGREISEDEDWKELLLGAVSVSGMLGVDAAHYQRRVVARVQPGEQWTVEMELRRRIRLAFREADIDFALPRFSETS